MVALVQRPAPAFKAEAVAAGQFTEVSLADYLGKWVVLFFYPMDFTFVCPTEIIAFNDALPEFANLNTEVLAVSTDSKFSHFAWATQSRKEGGLGPNLRLPLIADRNMAISRDYGVLLEDEGISLRGLFIIDPKGTLRQITVNDLPVGRSVDETIRLIKAFQFNVRLRCLPSQAHGLTFKQEKHGEVCPVNWTEGSKTIKADPIAKLEYFGAANDEANGDADGAPKKRARTE
ncbi:thioredoxin-like protein [Coprinopsis sp. MPI-PUGE-AT-0042]|nr:thioredoxin-like protein [Coprinopsis sp. MPI-PUGE-AT-0042]